MRALTIDIMKLYAHSEQIEIQSTKMETMSQSERLDAH